MYNIKKTVKILFVCICTSIPLLAFIQNNKMGIGNNDNVGLVPNEETAIKIAEAIWLPIYGENIYQNKPFKARLKNKIWIVEGSVPIEAEGGAPYIEIQRSNCKVLKVTHYK